LLSIERYDQVRFLTFCGNCPAEELLAAAKKMPSGMEDSLSAQPEALRFLQEASDLQLSPEEWERMTGSLRELRSSETPRRRKP
jgi:hypothetical protein